MRGEGLSLRARRRLDEVTPSAAALPPVPGFRDPPRKDVGPPEPPLTDENYHLWGVQLDDVVAEHVREVWVDTVRCAGDLTVRGRWFLRPLRSLEVGPAVVDLRSAEVSFGQLESWASDLRGSIGVTLRPPDLRAATGTDFIDHASVDADAGAILRADLVMNRLLASGEDDATVVTRAVAPVHVRLFVERGLVRPGTHLVAEPFDAEVRRATLSLRTRAEADVRVEYKDGQNVGIASARASSSGLFARSAEVATAETLATVVTSHELHLMKLISDPSDAVVSADLAGAQTDALDYWRSLAPPAGGVTVSGQARVDAHVAGPLAEAMRGRVAGIASVAVDRLELRGKSMGLKADARGHLELRRDGAGFDLSGSRVSLQDVRATVDRSGATLDLLVPSIAASTSSFDAGPAGLRGDVSVDIPTAAIPDLAPLTAVLPLPDGITVETGQAKASAQLNVDLESLRATGRAQVTATNLKINAWGDTLSGELAVMISARAARSCHRSIGHDRRIHERRGGGRGRLVGSCPARRCASPYRRRDVFPRSALREC